MRAARTQPCRASRLVLSLIASGLSSTPLLGQCGEWVKGPGAASAYGAVSTILPFDPDGGGPKGEHLLVAGAFSMIGGENIDFAAIWNGGHWEGLGAGVDQSVKCVTRFQNEFVVGGFFTKAGGAPATRIARWDGASWHTMGAGLDGVPNAMCVFDDKLIVCGSFVNAGGMPVNRIASWNGRQWSALGSGLDGSAGSLLVQGQELLVGGSFTTAGGVLSPRLARWDGRNWIKYPVAPPVSVDELLEHNGELFAIVSLPQVIRWEGTKWLPVGGVANGPINAIYSFGDELYAGGQFSTIGPVAAESVAKWNGSAWEPVGAMPKGSCYALGAYLGDLFAGVAIDFDTAPAINLVRWDDPHWFPGVGSPEGALLASRPYNGGLLIGVSEAFSNIGFSNPLQFWDGTKWSWPTAAIGNINSTDLEGVTTIEEFDGDLYVGGKFTQASGVPVNHIARWDGSAWSALGVGAVPFHPSLSVVRELLADGDSLIVGGAFTSIGGISGGIARWDGAQWHAMGLGIDGLVSGLTVYNNEVVASGQFATAGGVAVNNIAAWDGVAWKPLGLGLGVGGSASSHVYELTVHDGDLIAGGGFTTAGGNPALRIARWDGAAWYAMGAGLSGGFGGVTALASYNGQLYAGGGFGQHIARWDGTAWNPVVDDSGKSVSGWVDYLGVYNGELLVGGLFETAGGKPSKYFAKWVGLKGDLNGDGTVNQSDLGLLLQDYGCTVPTPNWPRCAADLDGDGDTDQSDLAILLAGYGSSCP